MVRQLPSNFLFCSEAGSFYPNSLDCNGNICMSNWLDILVMKFCIYPFLLAALIPIKIYPNAEADKAKILKDNKNKSGIYM